MSLLRSQASSTHTLQQEKQALEEKIEELEFALAESETNANVIDTRDNNGQY